MCADDSSSDLATSSLDNIPKEILRHIVDVHCHPTDSPSIAYSFVDDLPIRVCAMASRRSDQELVAQLARERPDKVIPAFGYHPWFTHLISLKPVAETEEGKKDHYRTLLLPSKGSSKPTHEEALDAILPILPHPWPLDALLAEVRQNISTFLQLHNQNPKRHPRPMLGEVGLDRSFRIPYAPHRSVDEDIGSSRPGLTPLMVPIEHQSAILEAQLDLAVELSVNVSLHSVLCPGPTRASLDRMRAKHGQAWTRISIDFHSCGVSADTWRDIERLHPNTYLSLSTGINLRKPSYRDLCAACSPDRLLVESDIHRMDECAPRTWHMLTLVAEIKGWALESADWAPTSDTEDIGAEAQVAERKQAVHESNWGAVRRLEANWCAFARGGEVPGKVSRRKRKKADRQDALLDDEPPTDEKGGDV